MSSLGFEKLREGLPGCPSDLRLDRWLAESLGSEEQQSTAAHIEGCTTCTARVTARRSGFDAFPEVDERRLLSGIRRRLAEEELAREKGRLQRIKDWLKVPRQLAMVGGALAMAAVVVVLARPPQATQMPAGDPNIEPTGVRIKGGLSLHVYRQRGVGSEQVHSGDRLRRGDNLRFAVDLPRAARISIVGVDSRGELYVAWPLRQPTAAAQPESAATALPAGPSQQLPGAVTLDDAQGEESFYLVACPPAGALPQCVSQGAGQAPACPMGCALSRFRFTKEP